MIKFVLGFFLFCAVVLAGIILFLPQQLLSFYTDTLSSETALSGITDLSSARQIRSTQTVFNATNVSFEKMQFKVPWRDLESQDRGIDTTILRFKSNKAILLTIGQQQHEAVLAFFISDDQQRDEIATVFDAGKNKTDFALFKLMLQHSPSQVTLLPKEETLENNGVALNVKELFLTLMSGNKGAGSFTTDTIHGVQVGNPRVINKVLLEIFGRRIDQYNIWIKGRVTQQEIDAILASVVIDDYR